MTVGKHGWALKFQRTKDQNNTKTQRAIYKRHNYWTLCFINFACNIGNSFLRTRWQQLADIQNRCLEREELCYKFGVYYICIIFCIVVLTLMSHAINIHIFSWYALGMVEQLLKIGNAWFDKLPQKQRKIGSWLMKECHEDNQSIQALTENIKQRLDLMMTDSDSDHFLWFVFVWKIALFVCFGFVFGHFSPLYDWMCFNNNMTS